jgi:hypothetical protein
MCRGSLHNCISAEYALRHDRVVVAEVLSMLMYVLCFVLGAWIGAVIVGFLLVLLQVQVRPSETGSH